MVEVVRAARASMWQMEEVIESNLRRARTDSCHEVGGRDGKNGIKLRESGKPMCLAAAMKMVSTASGEPVALSALCVRMMLRGLYANR